MKRRPSKDHPWRTKFKKTIEPKIVVPEEPSQVIFRGYKYFDNNEKHAKTQNNSGRH